MGTDRDSNFNLHRGGSSGDEPGGKPVKTKDVILDWILAFVAILVLGSALMLVVALPAIFSAENNSNQVRDGNATAACRSTYRAKIDDAAADLQIVIAEGLAAIAQDNDEALDQAALELAETELALKEATDHYTEAVNRSSSDPEAFLRECEAK